jgi:DNA-directed RNA polymerase specialized sigma24 family protein
MRRARLVQRVQEVPGVPLPRRARGNGLDADHTLTALYLAHYRPLVQVAALLVQDLAAAEEIAQDSFVAAHAAWRRLPDADHALACLYRCVVDRSRAVLGGRMGAGPPPADRAAALREAGVGLGSSAFIWALWALPPRQREIVVLRYFADLSDSQVASATRISPGGVRTETARAMTSLQAGLEGPVRAGRRTDGAAWSS